MCGSLSLKRLFVSKNVPNNAGMSKGFVIFIVLVIFDCDVTTLFGTFLETNKHQNLVRLRGPLVVGILIIPGVCHIHAMTCQGFPGFCPRHILFSSGLSQAGNDILISSWNTLNKLKSHHLKSIKRVIPYHSLFWSIHTKNESKRGTAFAFIYGVNWLWHHPLECFVMKLNVTEWQVSWYSCFEHMLHFISWKKIPNDAVTPQRKS